MLVILCLLISPILASLNSTSSEPIHDQVHCPSADDAVSSCDPGILPLNYTLSPIETLLTHYECCGDGLMLCCMRIKQWALLTGIGIGALIFALFACCCIKWKKTRQSYDFA